MSFSSSNNAPLPPLPPPPPPQNPNFKISPSVLNLRSKPPESYTKAPKLPPPVNIQTAPKGPYFLYGTLTDPSMLAEILSLGHEPELRPAYIQGYECSLWGQYPALLDVGSDDEGKVVEGAVYNVGSVEDGGKLAAYETGYYRAERCLIRYVDGEEPGTEVGSTFMFVGNSRELSEGRFDLRVWLKRMGRMEALAKLEKLKAEKVKRRCCYGSLNWLTPGTTGITKTHG